MSDGRCPFCPPPADRVIHEDDLVVAFRDGFPVSPGHVLIVPRRHVADWFDATRGERIAILDALDVAKATILREHRPDGWNVGVNVGRAAGQTVFHLHVHLIPRFDGDVADPRGGIRHVLPDKADYWSGGAG